MATKKTEKTDKSSQKKKAPATRKAPAKKAAVKEKKPPKQKVVESKSRHPKGRVLEVHGGKAALAKTLAGAVARGDEDTDQVEARLKTASNAQLLRLAAAAATVKEKWGNREKLIAAIGGFENKGKDNDFLAKLDTYSLPQLLHLALAAERRARA